MKAVIKHEIPGRMRVHFNRKRFSYREADTPQYYLQGFKCIEKAVVYERTADAVIRYTGNRGEIIRIIRGYAPDEADVPAGYFESSPRELNAEYYDHIVASVALYCGKTFLLPSPVRTVLTCVKAARYVIRGAKTIPERKLKVELLDAAATMIRKNTTVNLNSFTKMGGSPVSLTASLSVDQKADESSPDSIIAGLNITADLKLDKEVLSKEQYGLQELSDMAVKYAKDPEAAEYEFHIVYQGGELKINDKPAE